MASATDFYVGLALGLGPALGLLWFSLRRFDKPHTEYALFDDRRVFGTLAVGLIFGTVASWIEGIALAGFSGTIIALAFFFLFEESFKLVYLNRRGYRGRFDTTFYGVPLGVGAAATSVVSTVVGQPSGVLGTPSGLGLLVLFSVSLCFVNADTGALIGFGATRGDMMRSFLKALGVRFAHGALMAPFLLASGAPAGPQDLLTLVSFVGLAASLGLALIVYHYAYTTLFHATLPEDVQREMRRDRRRARTARE
jgi:hypothetical protein